MALVELVMDRENVGLFGPVWVVAPSFNMLEEVCFEFCVPLWTAGRHDCFMGERRDDGCTASKVCVHACDR